MLLKMREYRGKLLILFKRGGRKNKKNKKFRIKFERMTVVKNSLELAGLGTGKRL